MISCSACGHPDLHVVGMKMEWETSFSLPASTRQQVLRHLRLMNSRASAKGDATAHSSHTLIAQEGSVKIGSREGGAIAHTSQTEMAHEGNVQIRSRNGKGDAIAHTTQTEMARKGYLQMRSRKVRNLSENVAAETSQSDQLTILGTVDASGDGAVDDARTRKTGSCAVALRHRIKTRSSVPKEQELNRKRRSASPEYWPEDVNPQLSRDEVQHVAADPTTGVAFLRRISRKRSQKKLHAKDQIANVIIPPALHNAASEDTSEIEKLPRRLDAEFYKCDALDLAPRLLGKFLRRDDVVLQITEVEAYRPNDSACHGRFGITARTAPVFGPGGHAYVYLCYGLHIMLNVVADREGVGAAVLIRSCAPVAGIKTIQHRRGQVTDKPVLLTGPGKVGQSLGLTTDWSNHPFYTPGGLEILDGPAPENILIGPRVGIDYATPEDTDALWRFAIAGTPWISAPRNTLRSA